MSSCPGKLLLAVPTKLCPVCSEISDYRMERLSERRDLPEWRSKSVGDSSISGSPILRSPGLTLAAQAHNDLALHNEQAPVAVAHHIEPGARRECRSAGLPLLEQSPGAAAPTAAKMVIPAGLFSCHSLQNRKLLRDPRGQQLERHLCQSKLRWQVLDAHIYTKLQIHNSCA